MLRFRAISNTWLISDLLRFSSTGSSCIYMKHSESSFGSLTLLHCLKNNQMETKWRQINWLCTTKFQSSSKQNPCLTVIKYPIDSVCNINSYLRHLLQYWLFLQMFDSFSGSVVFGCLSRAALAVELLSADRQLHVIQHRPHRGKWVVITSREDMALQRSRIKALFRHFYKFFSNLIHNSIRDHSAFLKLQCNWVYQVKYEHYATKMV